MMEKFNLPFREHLLGLYSGTLAQDLEPLFPARFVPVLRTHDGEVIGESLAMAETLAERHPDKHLWPRDPSHRARARWLCAEMVAGFSDLRGSCPMQLQHVNRGFQATSAVGADVARIETLWQSAWEMAGTQDGWLFGDYSLADVFYAPVAARIIGYDLEVSEAARAYCLRTLKDPSFVAWRKSGLAVTYDPFPYETHEPTSPWPET